MKKKLKKCFLPSCFEESVMLVKAHYLKTAASEMVVPC